MSLEHRTAKRSRARVLIIDDHPVFREGLKRVLGQEKDMEVCGEATDPKQGLAKLGALKPDLVLLEISLEGMNGLDLTKLIRQRAPKTRILIFSMQKESLYADRALRAGANGYLMKREATPLLLKAIREVLQGHVYVSKAVNEAVLQQLSVNGRPANASPVKALSDREFEIFRLVGQGYGTRLIADRLHISIKTVETHREHIREKLNLGATFDLVQYAIHWIHHESAAP